MTPALAIASDTSPGTDQPGRNRCHVDDPAYFSPNTRWIPTGQYRDVLPGLRGIAKSQTRSPSIG
jgi:hypothetical protein